DLCCTGSTTAEVAGRVAPDVLGLILLLGRVGVVGRLRLGLRVRDLIRGARARGDVATGDVHRHVRVDGVLLADRGRPRPLLGVGCLDADLCCTGSTTTDLAGRVAPDVLGLILLLGRVGVVGRLRLGLRVRDLIRGARARGDVATGDVHRHVRVDGVLLAHGQRTRPLGRVRELDAGLEAACAATTDLAGRVAPDVLGLILLLGRVGVVGRLRLGLRVRDLIRGARARGDVATGDV